MKYVYACIGYKCSMDDAFVRNTKKYKKAEKVAKLLKADDFVYDFCTSWERSKPQLEKLLTSKGNIIIVTDITALGAKNEIFDIYNRIINSGNEILFCYFGKSGVLETGNLSTISIYLTKDKILSLDERMEIINGISVKDYRSTASLMPNPDIINSYWSIEKNETTQKAVTKEMKISPNTHLRRMREYVGTNDWYKRYMKELQSSSIITVPSRLAHCSDDGIALYLYLSKHPQANALSIPELAYKAGIVKEIPMSITALTEESDIEAIKNSIKAYDAYRHMLRYDKYQKRLKYRT